MVQGEKSSSSMLAASSCVAARTSDPFARKAGFEAMQRNDTKVQGSGGGAFGGKDSTSKGASSSNTPSTYGSWGPVFQNKQNFASMHFC